MWLGNRREPCELLGQQRSQSVRMHIREALKKKPRLSPDGSDNCGVAMTDRGHSETRRKIDEAVAVDVENVGAQRFFPDQRCAIRAQGVDTRSFVPGQPARDSAGFGTGWRVNDSWREVAPTESGHGSELSAPRQGPSEGHLIGVFDIATHRHAERETGNPSSARFEEPGQIEGGSFTLDVGIGRQDDLLDTIEAVEETGDPKLVRADTPLGRESSHQDVVPTMELSCAFYRLNVVRLFDDTDPGRVTLRIGAESTGFNVGDRVTDRAMEELVLDLQNRRREGFGVGPGDLEQVVSESRCRFGTDARQAREFADKTGKWITHGLCGGSKEARQPAGHTAELLL